MCASEGFKPSEEYPYFQLTVLLSAGFTSALALTGLFPYVAFMVVDLHAAKDVDSAGYVSGYVASSFMFGRLMSSYYWGRVADQIGRKPVFYIALTGISLMTILFGLSVNIWMALITRFILGLVNPVAGLIKTIVSEICLPKHQSSAMSLVAGSWSIGLVVGPALGGGLARISTQYPDSAFANWSLFREFPYFLPNAITAVLCMISLVMMYLYFPETLPPKTPPKGNEVVESTSGKALLKTENEIENEKEVDSEKGIDDDEFIGSKSLTVVEVEEKKREKDKSGFLGSAMELLKNPAIVTCLVAYFSISFTAIVFDECLPLWALTSPAKGGLNYSSRDVGLMVSFTGIPMAIFTFIGVPVLSRYFGSIRGFCYGQFLLTFFAFFVVFMPLMNSSSDSGDEPAEPSVGTFCMLLVITTLTKMSGVHAFTNCFLLINHSVERVDQRGSVNGLAMTIGSIAKTLGPFLGGSIYAWSVQNGLPAPGNYMFVFLGNLCIGIFTLIFLPTKYLREPEQKKEENTEVTERKDKIDDKNVEMSTFPEEGSEKMVEKRWWDNGPLDKNPIFKKSGYSKIPKSDGDSSEI